MVELVGGQTSVSNLIGESLMRFGQSQTSLANSLMRFETDCPNLISEFANEVWAVSNLSSDGHANEVWAVSNLISELANEVWTSLARDARSLMRFGQSQTSLARDLVAGPPPPTTK